MENSRCESAAFCSAFFSFSLKAPSPAVGVGVMGLGAGLMMQTAGFPWQLCL